MAKLFDCFKCPAYCCTYDYIPITKEDRERLAKNLKMSLAKVTSLFTKKSTESTSGRIMRQQNDPVFGKSCVFLHKEKRICTIYTFRPAVCREYPMTKKCGWYDFMQWERKLQDDPEYIPFSV